jgi:hypothetical protein
LGPQKVEGNKISCSLVLDFVIPKFSFIFGLYLALDCNIELQKVCLFSLEISFLDHEPFMEKIWNSEGE